MHVVLTPDVPVLTNTLEMIILDISNALFHRFRT